MLTTLLADMATATFATRATIILIISGFMPLSALSFFYYMLDKKKVEFNKEMEDIGLNSKNKFNEAYNGRHYFLPVIFSFIICFLAITVIMYANDFQDTFKNSILLTGSSFGEGEAATYRARISIEAISFAFMGAFIWAATNIIRRLIAYDLTPNVYYSAGVRIILACMISVILSFVIPDLGAIVLPAVAFIAGTFPERVFNFILEKYKDFVEGDRILDKQLSLDNIEGISMSHKERLMEMGIDNAQNLAAYSLTQLMVKTPFSTREILDWIGQAKLLVYVKGEMDEYRRIGLRSAFDFFKGLKRRYDMQALAEAKGIDPTLMGLVYDQLRDDEGVKNLFEFERRMNSPNSKKSKPKYDGKNSDVLKHKSKEDAERDGEIVMG